MAAAMVRPQFSLILPLSIGVGLAGCSHWTKPGVSDEGQRRLDAYACARDAGLVGLAFGMTPSDEHFDQCMAARGYMRTSSP